MNSFHNVRKKRIQEIMFIVQDSLLKKWRGTKRMNQKDIILLFLSWITSVMTLQWLSTKLKLPTIIISTTITRVIYLINEPFIKKFFSVSLEQSCYSTIYNFEDEVDTIDTTVTEIFWPTNH